MCDWECTLCVCVCVSRYVMVCMFVPPNLFVFLRRCLSIMHLCAVFVCHPAVKVSLRSRAPVSCQTVRDAAPLKGMLSGSFLSIISPATLIKAVTVHPHVPQAAGEKKKPPF